MLLTGKCKEDFLKWSLLNRSIITDYHENHILSDIIEWFDSVGVYVFIERATYVFKPNFIYRIDVIDDLYEGYSYTTRQQATKEAIIKANEIYNEKFGYLKINTDI